MFNFPFNDVNKIRKHNVFFISGYILDAMVSVELKFCIIFGPNVFFICHLNKQNINPDPGLLHYV